MTALTKPASVASNEFKSAKWDEITQGRNFEVCDIPALSMLVQWYAIAEKCIDDMNDNGETNLVYMNDIGDLKGLPQVNMLKQASAEIRQFNKQLGINDEKPIEKPKRQGAILNVITANRGARAKNSRASAAG